VDGALPSGASGGDAASAGFTVSTGGSTVLGFSFTGGTIPAGCGTLTSLSFDGNASGLSGIVMSDPSGNSIEFDYYDGSSGPEFGTATVQIIHNSASPTVDVYVDGGLAISGFEYRTATGLLELPTSFTVGIAPTGGEVIADFPFELVDGGSYVVVATGLLGDTTTPFGLAATAADFNQADATVVGLNVYHGSTDAPAVDIWADDAPLLTSFSYGDFSGPVEVPAADYTLGVAPAGGDIIAAFTAPLSGLGGGTAVVFASGFLSGDDPAFGLFAALTDGTVLTLPSLDQDCAGEWGGDAVVDACGVCGGTETDQANCSQYYTDLPEETGESSLVIIQNVMGLEPGDEIGLFDANGVTESVEAGGTPIYGNTLVGSGVYTGGDQLEIVGVASVDLSDFGGPVLNGYVQGNPIVYKVWKVADQMEYDATVEYSAGSGDWGAVLTVVSMLEPIFTVVQVIDMNPYQTNMVSLCVTPEDNSTTSLFSDLDILLISNDASEFYVPEFGVDQVGSIDVTDGFNCFLNGPDVQSVSVEGLPVEDGTLIELMPFMINIMPFLPQECMPTSEVFAGYEDQILIVKNDASEYFVPAFGVSTLDEMCPGEGYAVFLNGGSSVDFMYPMGLASLSDDLRDLNDDYKQRAHRDDVNLTGESHLVIVDDISGKVQEGDILRAYANDNLVGSINIVDEHLAGIRPIDLVAHGSVDLSSWDGPVLPGYDKGDQIELRLFSRQDQVELKVDIDLNVNVYGENEQMSFGSANVYDAPAIPTSFKLAQNYPNPFNPVTTIEYNVANSSFVTLEVYDVMGRLVKTLVDNQWTVAGQTSGYSVNWNGVDDRGQRVSAGLYIYRLQSGSMTTTNKMILLK